VPIVCHVAAGEVISVAIMNDKYIGGEQSRGYGFVEMPSVSEGQAAITALNGKTLRHRTIGQLMLFMPSLFLTTVAMAHIVTREEAGTVGM